MNRKKAIPFQSRDERPAFLMRKIRRDADVYVLQAAFESD